jgi:hypothetical protein
MNNFFQTMRNFNRFELKYIIDLKQAEAIKKVLQHYMTPDTYGDQDGCYTIANLYYDSPNFRCYWEKENGIKYRRKLRMRHYETDATLTDETPVFVEIKQRVDRVTQKRRAILPYQDALRLCNDRQISKHDPVDRDAIKEIYVYLWQYNLVPANIVRYRRQAFIGTIYDAGLRVTFDTNLSFQVAPLHLHEKRTRLSFLPADQVVLEIKVNERIPYWLTEMIAAKNLQLYRISKYCCSIEAAWDLPSIQYRNLIAEPSREVLSSTYSVPVFWNSLYPAEKNQNNE